MTAKLFRKLENARKKFLSQSQYFSDTRQWGIYEFILLKGPLTDELEQIQDLNWDDVII